MSRRKFAEPQTWRDPKANPIRTVLHPKQPRTDRRTGKPLPQAQVLVYRGWSARMANEARADQRRFEREKAERGLLRRMLGMAAP